VALIAEAWAEEPEKRPSAEGLLSELELLEERYITAQASSVCSFRASGHRTYARRGSAIW